MALSLAELRRRNVFRVATFYVVAGWVLLQAGGLLFDMLDVPKWSLKLLLGLLVLGFPVALVISWVYELTPEGLKREHEVVRDESITRITARKLDALVIALLVVAIGLLVANGWSQRGTGRDAGRDQRDSQSAVTETAAPTTSASAQATGSPAAAGMQASIAVLPFLNMSDDKTNEYFSDGLTEELLNVLANVPGLRVIARTSSFAYKGKDVKIADVARDLKVDHVLEGSVRKSGNRVRITTQLIRAADSSHLWSKTYDRDLDDIFAVQDEISNEVVGALKVRLLPGEKAPTVEVGGTHDARAYEAYLRGRHLRSQGEAEKTLRAALAELDEAIRLDPEYAMAYAAKSSVLQPLASNAYMPFDTGFAQSRQAAQRALDLAPDLAEGHLALASVQAVVDGNVRGAAASMERALQLNPGSEQVQRLYSSLASSLGRHEAAIAAAQKSVALDPISAAAQLNLAGALFSARRFAESEAAARRVLALQPDRASASAALGFALLMQRRYDEALQAFDAETVRWARLNGRSLVFAMSGKTQEARRELQAFQKAYGDNAAFQYAEAEAQLGNLDAAMNWLETARRVRDPGLTGFAYTDPTLDPLRKDPRFQRLIIELGFDATSST